MSRLDTQFRARSNLKLPMTGAVLAVAISACSGSQPYSSPVSTSAATTFDCVRGQLVQMGYSIDDADRDRGIVVGSLGLAMQADAETALVLSAEIESVEAGATSKLSIKPYRQATTADGNVDRDSDVSAEADARSLLTRCGGRVDQGEPDRPYGIRPEITTTP